MEGVEVGFKTSFEVYSENLYLGLEGSLFQE
jgi:hypothetical protein